ncbi:glycosyltransferase family 2 protein [Persephonella sp. KM09-Lau-8]|uniref:glycosyltransferase family 2 protein n=1 Tax=Persephonella sp. KM09-Lau-8 TaxID=1158345 RepID=UPI0004977E38|nr:glycosyltransferase family 2 protein [Persephonella sp. KM09-Lau-8]
MISVLIAAYNEERFIGRTLEDVLSLPFDKEVIVVDDGSTDGTYSVLESFGRDIILVRNSKNRGKGYSLRKALEYASKENVVIQDADGEYPPFNIERLIERKEKANADMVVGMRMMDLVALYRDVSLASFVANKIFVKLIGIPDVFSGQRLIKTDLARKMNLESDGFEIETEISLKALRLNASIEFVPIYYYPRKREEGKKIGFQDFIKISKYYLKFRLSEGAL